MEISNLKLLVPLVLVLFLLSLFFQPISPLFFIVTVYLIALRTTPFERGDFFLAYVLFLHFVLVLASGLVTSFVNFNNYVLFSTLLAMFLISLKLKPKEISYGDKCLLRFSVLILLTIAIFGVSNFYPGTVTENGAFFPFIYTADAWYHLSVVQTIFNGIVPPTNPHLSGFTLEYYWFFHMYMAAMARFVSITPLLAFRIVSLIILLGVSATAYLLASKFFKNPWLPAMLVVLAGPLAKYNLGVGGKLLAFPYFDILVEPHPQTLGLALFFAAIYFYLKSFDNRKFLPYAIASFAFLPGVHTLSFIVLAVLVMAHFILKEAKLTFNIGYTDYAATLLFAAVAIYFHKLFYIFIPALLVAIFLTVRKTKFDIKFSSKGFDIPAYCIIAGLLFSSYYLVSVIGSNVSYPAGVEQVTGKYQQGSYLLLGGISALIGTFGFPIIVLLLFFPMILKNSNNESVRLPLIFLMLFLVIGFAGKIPLIFGAEGPLSIFLAVRRFLNLVPVFISLLAWFVIENKVKNRFAVYFLVLLFILPSFAGVLLRTFDNTPYGPGPIYVSHDELAAFEWIRENTPVNSTFIIYPSLLFGDRPLLRTGGEKVRTNHPLPTLAGRTVVIGSDEYSSLFNPDASDGEILTRFSDVRLFYSAPESFVRYDIAQKYGVEYVYVGNQELQAFLPEQIQRIKSYETVFESGNISVHRIRAPEQ